MPLARVRTTLPAIPEELKQQLHAAGYDIEIVRPGKKVSSPADLELTIESLPVAEAMTAASRARTVYVSPGILPRPATPVPSKPRPEIAIVPPAPERQKRDAEQQLLAQRRAEQERIEAERLRREQEAVRKDNERQHAEQMRLQQLRAEQQRVAEQERRARMQAEQQRAEQDRIEQQRAEQQRAEQDRIEQQRAEQQRAEQERAAEVRAEQQRAETDLNARLQAERERVEAGARNQQRVLQMWREAEARHTQPDSERVRLQEQERLEKEREAELRRHAQLAEEQRLNELREQNERELRAREEEHRRWQAEQERIQQEQQQVRLELQRKEEEIRNEQQRLRAERERFLRDRLMNEQALERARLEAEANRASVVPISSVASLESAIAEPTGIRTASGETANLTVTPVSKGAQFVERRKRPRLPLIEGGARRLRHKEYRRAAFVAAGLTVVVMGLWAALSAREPASPLSTNKLMQGASMEQSSPFGPAKLNAPVEVGHPANQQIQPAAANQASSTQPAAKPVQTKKTAAKPSPRTKSRTTRRAQIANDNEVVVRHFGRRATATNTKKTASTNKAGVKVFSDMD